MKPVFIDLTHHRTGNIYSVNANTILYMFSNSGGSTTLNFGTEHGLTVKESIEEIQQKIANAAVLK